MEFHAGDRVVHRAHGLGQVMAIEERVFNNKTAVYYMVQAADLTTPPETLPEDRRQRNLHLHAMLADGQAESLCRVIRDLAAYRHTRSWSEYDSALMKRTQKALISEWSFTFGISDHEAESELQRALAAQDQ
jgi:RNA polymerase-interacting CarD/CdnL/TRCF family regulator